MRLLWLPEVLRAAGLTVHEVSGWRTRGDDSYGPVRGITVHHTAGARTSTDAGEIGVLLRGSQTAPPPISQLYLSRTGHWHVVASGLCYHNLIGWGGPNSGYGNDSLLGIEAQHSGAGEPWTDVQYRSYVRGVAALVRHRASGYSVTVARVAGHKEHQPGAKSDPSFDMDRFRRDVSAALANPQEDDEMTPAEKWVQHVMNYRVEALRANRAVIRIPARPDLGAKYRAVTETNGLAVALAVLAARGEGLDQHAVIARVEELAAAETARDEAAAVRDERLRELVEQGVSGQLDAAAVVARMGELLADAVTG